MIEPIDPYRSTDSRFQSPEGTANIIMNKLNEVIEEANAFHRRIAELEDWSDTLSGEKLPKKDQPNAFDSNGNPIKLGYISTAGNWGTNCTPPCEHPRWKHGTCLACGKPAPAGEKRIDYSNGLDYIREKAIAAYKVGLKQKIAGMKQCKDRMDGQATPIELTNDYNQALDAVLKLLGEE